MIYGIHILVADDDADDMDFIEEAILTFEPGAILLKVKTGRAAVRMLEQRADHELPQLMILDYNMPEMNGPEVLAHLCGRDKYASIPKVVLSTSNSPLHLRECLERGATEYFTKPSTKAELNDLVKHMLEYAARLNDQ
jgi:CheY-like chemotaxis protein